ncbi:aminotransferase class I/II-fold pyridoxal phosphate-dependent enzyme [Francisella sp. SYW-9]|uniref:aminotransferase class I/II-fold pyridoxal phosphate-dependent enzyme n=1 Tax=Francisella sp. SYW-9 TaxID=2610888 RepID=UPI00123DB41C|nr:aminotransferase class I/II-fold pyridoxal phosphate-dependent enzyme [Francisella sp. SYW-9]
MIDENKFNWHKNRVLMSKAHQSQAAISINNRVVNKRENSEIEIEGCSTKLIEFASSSYLGLDHNKKVIDSVYNNLDKYGINFAISRTRLRNAELDVLENLLSKIFCNSSVIVFSSLHLAHMSFLPLLSSGEIPSFPIKKSPLFIMDKFSHSSLQMQISALKMLGEIKRIDFQDKTLLEDSFKEAFNEGKTPISISDSIISMGGVNSSKLLINFAEKYNGYVYLDDAHGTSVYGKHGCGYVLSELDEKFHPRLIVTPSLSKGFGSNGGAIALPTLEDKLFLKKFCTSYIFSNPPAMPLINASIAASEIHLSEEINTLQEQLYSNLNIFDRYIDIDYQIINYKTKLPIRGILIKDESKAILFANELLKKGFYLCSAMYPSVEKNKSMLRISISAKHKANDIKRLCETINELAVTH